MIIRYKHLSNLQGTDVQESGVLDGKGIEKCVFDTRAAENGTKC